MERLNETRKDGKGSERKKRSKKHVGVAEADDRRFALRPIGELLALAAAADGAAHAAAAEEAADDAVLVLHLVRHGQGLPVELRLGHG